MTPEPVTTPAPRPAPWLWCDRCGHDQQDVLHAVGRELLCPPCRAGLDTTPLVTR